MITLHHASPPLQLGRLKVHEEGASVLVRILDASREGQMEAPATAAPLEALRTPGYLWEVRQSRCGTSVCHTGISQLGSYAEARVEFH